MNRERFLYTVVFIAITAFAFVFLLSLTNQATIEQVELNQQIARERAILQALTIAPQDEDGNVVDAEVPQVFDERVTADKENGRFVATIEGQTVWAKEFAGSGLWGTITGVLAVTSDLSEIIGLEIVSDNETPGLGGRINEPWYTNQWEGEEIPQDGTIELTAQSQEGDPDKDNGLVDGITGATRTSESMVRIVTSQLAELRSDDVQNAFEELESSGGNS